MSKARERRQILKEYWPVVATVAAGRAAEVFGALSSVPHCVLPFDQPTHSQNHDSVESYCTWGCKLRLLYLLSNMHRDSCGEWLNPINWSHMEVTLSFLQSKELQFQFERPCTSWSQTFPIAFNLHMWQCNGNCVLEDWGCLCPRWNRKGHSYYIPSLKCWLWASAAILCLIVLLSMFRTALRCS